MAAASLVQAAQISGKRQTLSPTKTRSSGAGWLQNEQRFGGGGAGGASRSAFLRSRSTRCSARSVLYRCRASFQAASLVVPSAL
jgi:hypothetical protein